MRLKPLSKWDLRALVGAVVGGTMVLASPDDSNEEKIGGWIVTCSAFLSKDVVAGFRLMRMKIKHKLRNIGNAD